LPAKKARASAKSVKNAPVSVVVVDSDSGPEEGAHSSTSVHSNELLVILDTRMFGLVQVADSFLSLGPLAIRPFLTLARRHLPLLQVSRPKIVMRWVKQRMLTVLALLAV